MGREDALHDEHHGTKARNDTDSCPTLRTGVRGIYLAASLDAEARSKVQTRLLPNWLRVLDTAELAQIDQRVCQQLHAIPREGRLGGDSFRRDSDWAHVIYETTHDVMGLDGSLGRRHQGCWKAEGGHRSAGHCID